MPSVWYVRAEITGDAGRTSPRTRMTPKRPESTRNGGSRRTFRRVRVFPGAIVIGCQTRRLGLTFDCESTNARDKVMSTEGSGLKRVRSDCQTSE
jgi:hypothetical protein